MDNWISVLDRLPPRYKHVLLYSTKRLKRNGKIFDGWYSGKKAIFIFDSYCTVDGDQYKINVTHWQPLPPPPQLIHTQEEINNWDQSMDN